jgi:hypothetical protein
VLLSGAVGPVVEITERVHRHSLVYTPIEATSSVSDWIDQLKAGDHATAERLWERYFRRLMFLGTTDLARWHFSSLAISGLLALVA